MLKHKNKKASKYLQYRLETPEEEKEDEQKRKTILTILTTKSQAVRM